MGPNFHFELYIFLYFGLNDLDFNIREILPNRLGNSSYFKFHAILNDPDNKFKRFYSTLFIYLISNTLPSGFYRSLFFLYLT